MAGIKLRMPPGEFWQFLGESIGANPTPVGFAEFYTALQTGTVDGQDNPLVAARTMKFYEVTSQFVLTSHVIGYDMLSVSKKAWASLKPAQQAKFRAEADKIFDANAAKYDAQEKDAIEFFKKEGKQVYTPDQDAFRKFAQKKYLDKYGNGLAEGRAREDQRDQVIFEHWTFRRGMRPVVRLDDGRFPFVGWLTALSHPGRADGEAS